MTRTGSACRTAVRGPLAFCLAFALVQFTAGLGGCDRNVNSSKTTSTKTTSGPEGTKKTTETTEKKTVTEPKNNP